MKKIFYMLLFISPGFLLSASGDKEAFHKTVDYVDLKRFSGDWYVVALIPTPFEKKAVNGVENYSVDEKGRIRVKYTFRIKSPDGKKKVMYQKGWIYNKKTNADWRVRPLWPLKLPYYILELDDNYTYTVIGTNNYKYLWIMSRNPDIDSNLLKEIITRMKERGYSENSIKIMQQSWKD